MKVEEEIRRRILAGGPITFAEFMELALYWPQGGYYLGSRDIGSSGDFYTSPHVHPAFGALIAVQLYQMWQVLGEPARFTVVEAGSGNGLLCHDAVAFAAQLPEGFRRSLHYLCLDYRRVGGAERDTPVAAGPPWVSRIAAAVPPVPTAAGKPCAVPLRGIQGCFLANELLDALPVHQLVLVQGVLREVYVTLRGGQLTTALGQPSTSELGSRLAALGLALEEGQIVEISLGIDLWAEQVAASLDAGFVLTIDYGQLAPELYSPLRRPRGTLTTYFRHTQTDAPLQRVGRQDISAQVDITGVIEAGRRAGLELLGLTTQGRFLANLGLEHFRRRLRSEELSRRHFVANNAGMLDLSRPGGLGDFKVLAQGKNVGPVGLWGLDASEDGMAFAKKSAVPLLTAKHLSLLEGRYPHESMEFDEAWPVSQAEINLGQGR